MITPFLGISSTSTGSLIKLEGVTLEFFKRALTSWIETICPSLLSPTAGAITTSLIEGVVKALVLISSITPIGAVPSETPATMLFPMAPN